MLDYRHGLFRFGPLGDILYVGYTQAGPRRADLVLLKSYLGVPAGRDAVDDFS